MTITKTEQKNIILKYPFHLIPKWLNKGTLEELKDYIKAYNQINKSNLKNDIKQNKIICPKCHNEKEKINCYECGGNGYIDARGL